jgi:mevalonate pyrophosphate decarboxylase
MVESNHEEERLARVEHTLEQIRKLQRDADTFKHHIAVQVVVQIQSGLAPSAARALRAEWHTVQNRVRRARAIERHR